MPLKSLFLCVAFAPALAGASQPVTLQPSSKWVLDYEDNSCRLIRTFGEGGDQLKLVFESVAPGEMTMLVLGGSVRAFPGSSIWAKFMPGQDAFFAGRGAEAENGQAAALWSHVPLEPLAAPPKGAPKIVSIREISEPPPAPIDLVKQAADRAKRLAFASSISGLYVQPGSGKPIILETGPLNDAMRMFDDCDRDLLRTWGVDPNVQAKIVRPVRSLNPGHWLTAGDYPADMLRVGGESMITVRVLVDTTGKVTDCRALSSYDAPSFNQTSCAAITRRAQFAPAELQDGTKVPSYFVTTVQFRMSEL